MVVLGEMGHTDRVLGSLPSRKERTWVNPCFGLENNLTFLSSLAMYFNEEWTCYTTKFTLKNTNYLNIIELLSFQKFKTVNFSKFCSCI